MNPKFKQVSNKHVRLAGVDDRADIALTEGDDAGGGKKKFHVRSQKWGGRAWMAVLPRGVTLKKKAWKLASSQESIDIECEGKKGKNPRGETHRLETGSLKWSVIYGAANDLPEEPYIAFDVSNPPGMEFHYQPALTQQEIDAGHVRPEDAVGSYAVYWPASGRILRADGTERVNYETGKYCHIYRPKWIDANGNWTWGEQSIVGAELRVAVPSAWLAGATWPVTLDPTFGYTSAGASAYGETNRMNAHRYTPASNGAITSFSVYASTNSGYGDFTLGAYSDTTGPKPSSLVVDTAGSTAVGGAWYTLNSDSSPSITAGTYYWLAVWGVARFFYDSTGTLYYYYNPTYSHGSLPAMWGGTANASNGTWSIYATYTDPPKGGLILPRRNRTLLRM